MTYGQSTSMLITNSKRKTRFLVGIAGGSGSGKTTLARKLIEECEKIGIAGRILSLDNYYRPLDHLKFEKRKAYNFDHPNAIDSTLALKHIKELCAGRSVRQPIYNFKLHTREKATTICHPTKLIIIEITPNTTRVINTFFS